MTKQTPQIGDKVKLLAGNIDKKIGQGEVGYVRGYARLSEHHGREVMVSDKPEGWSTAPWAGWFWASQVEVIETAQA